MKKLVCKSQEDLVKAAKVAENIINNTLRYPEDFNIRVLNLGIYADLDVVYTSCCEVTEFSAKDIFKAFNQIQKNI